MQLIIYCIIINSSNFKDILSVNKIFWKVIKQGMLYHYMLL